MSKREKIGNGDLIANIIIVLFAVVNLFPLYWLFTSSFKNSSDVVKMPPDWFPKKPTVQNYIDLFKNQPAMRWTFNSIFVALVTTLLVVLISSMAAYAFAKLEFKGRKTIFYILVASLMIPKEVLIVPLFKIIQAFDWMDTYKAMIFPNVALSFGVFLLKGFFETIPNSIRESAKIDGCSEWTIYRKIIIPIGKPGIGALFILMFVQVWNDYLWQLIIANTKDMKTLMVGVASLMEDLNPNFAYKMAGAAVGAIPMLIIFFMFQKYFTRGITIGAVKG
ncbi:carbohydrate ABC transporter permease [Xylanivirga thermophila]|uniref:carbohydrate ABC transporter permease n=1 Tax=Xylanivirga thermophila TaxID=2496273 RepID=UPI00101C506A|nr:carbohydrate ABC transporter permease [Xylanivirga thermophila]